MTLEEWLDHYGLAQADLARETGIDKSKLSLMCRRAHNTKLVDAYTVVEFTRGEVTYEELLPVSRPRTPLTARQRAHRALQARWGKDLTMMRSLRRR